MLLFIKDQELARRAFIEGLDRFRQRRVFPKEFGGKRVEQGREGLNLQKRFGSRQSTPQITRAAGDCLGQEFAERGEGAGDLREESAADLHQADDAAGTNACLMRTISQEGSLAKKVTLPQYVDNFCFLVFFRRLQDLDLAFFDDAEDPGRLSPAVYEVSRAIVTMGELLR